MIGKSSKLMIIDGGVMRKLKLMYGIKHYKNPMYKHRWDGFFWGICLGYIPYLWHMYI